MIKTSTQLGIAKQRLKELENAKEIFLTENKDASTAKYESGLNSLSRFVEDLEHDISEFERFRDSEFCKLKSENVFDLPKLIIQTRLTKKLSQSDLAKKIGVSTQQIQRYETNDYEAASWARMMDVMDAMEMTIKTEACWVGNLSFKHDENLSETTIKEASRRVYENHSLFF
jgi:transcriptional regulator with XRE-family HTH domain